MSYETLENNFLILNVKHHGAELSSVIDKITGFEYIWQAGESWKRHAPVLFPIIGRLIDNKYSFKQNIYNLNQHGFARDLPYTLISKTTNKLTFNLKSNVDTLYFSIGAHPAFNTNFNNGNLNDYSLKFSVDELITQPLENGLRNEKRNRIQLNEKALKLDKNLFKNDAIILGNNQINDIELIHQSQNHSVKLTCTNWPYFGIWTKENSKDFICLEPWYGITDHHQHNQILEEKEGILALESGHTFECAYCITFKTNN
jgi:galactose mutarotase-like enzyme